MSNELSNVFQNNDALNLFLPNKKLVMFLQNLENEIENNRRLEDQKYSPVQGRYFKVADQRTVRESHEHKGKREALEEMLHFFEEQIGPERRLELELTRAEMKKAAALALVDAEHADRVAKIKGTIDVATVVRDAE